MADFELKLSMLAERGTRVGPEEMIERVEAHLADDPFVVVSKQRKGREMSIKTDERQNQNRRGSTPGLIRAAAAFVVIVGLGVLYLALSDDGGRDVTQPAPTTALAPTTTAVVSARVSADIAVIEEYLTAWHSGDFDRAATMTDRVESPGAADWSQYEGAIGADIDVTCVPRAEDRVFDCEFSYSNDLYEAVDADPAILEWSGRVIDDESLEFLDLPLASFDTDVMRSWYSWQLEVGAESPCDSSAQPTPECAEFQLEHLDEWAVWYLADN